MKKGLSKYLSDDFKELMEEIHYRHHYANEVYGPMDDLYDSDVRFCDVDQQWPEDIKAQRQADERPCLTVDRINPFVHQVCNEQRQSRPQPQVNPVGDGADKETAEIFQGMIRHISTMSNGDTSIDTGFESMVRGGWGFVRVLTQYADETSFDQDIVIKRIPNPKDVRLDPSFDEPDGSDSEWAIIGTWVPKDTFKAAFPGSKMTLFTDAEWKGVGTQAPEWVTQDGKACLVVEYYKRIRESVTIYKLHDGSTTEDKPDDMSGVQSRRTLKPKVQWFKCSAVECLDSTEWPGKYIPIIPILGTELTLDGVRTWSGLIRSAKDPQRAYNYWKSAQAEMIALAPKAPFLAPKGAITNALRGAWQNVNKRSISVLEYEPIVNGQPITPPHRDMAEPPVRAITEAMVGAVDDLKATTGMYDPSLGNREASQSGVAIRQLQKQGATGNYHYQDNLSRAIRHLGRILVDLIPKVYDTQRVIRIIKPDESADLVTINGPTGKMNKETGVERVYKLGVGTYDVAVSVGPSYQTKRQENLALLESIMQGPMGQMLAQVAPDIVASMMDFSVAPQLVERLKKTLPPQLQDKEDGQGPQIPPEAMQQMQQMGQQLQMAQQAIQEIQGQSQQALQENQSLKIQMQNKQGEMQIKAQELELKGQEMQLKLHSEAAGVEIDQAKMDLDHQKLMLEAQKLQLEEMRLTLEAINSQRQLEPTTPEHVPEPNEPEPKDQGLSREDLAALFEAQTSVFRQGMESLMNQPPKTVTSQRTPSGITGAIGGK